MPLIGYQRHRKVERHSCTGQPAAWFRRMELLWQCPTCSSIWIISWFYAADDAWKTWAIKVDRQDEYEDYYERRGKGRWKLIATRRAGELERKNWPTTTRI